MNQRETAGLDKNLILVCEAEDYYYAINTGQDNDGENPVVNAILGISRKEFEIIAPDFGTFFLNEVKNISQGEY